MGGGALALAAPSFLPLPLGFLAVDCFPASRVKLLKDCDESDAVICDEAEVDPPKGEAGSFNLIQNQDFGRRKIRILKRKI